jgi:murein DD-endopeptidase MepM/ murein hydrolase activator NlpD
VSPVNKYKKVENSAVEFVSKQLTAFFGKISTSFNNLINAGKQRFTVMLIPHSEKKIFNFRISVFSLIVMVFLLGCMVTAFVIFTTQFKGLSGMLANRTDTLEKKESDLEIIRDQIAELKSVSRIFEASLSKTLSTLGIENSDMGNSSKGFIGSDFDSQNLKGKPDTSVMLRELEDLKTLSSFLNESVESFEEITGLLVSQGELLVELPTMWPLKNVRGRITNFFGPSVHPFTRKWYLHKGIDLAYKRGTPIVSTANGKVVEKGYEPLGFGNYVVIRHRYGFFTKYAHMDKSYIKEGQTVTQGQVIGRMGNTGLSTGPHLHYEVRIGSQVVDPERYLNIKNRLGK